MTIPSIPYEEFTASNQALVSDGGPWSIGSTEMQHAQCKSESQSYCGGYCLSCQVYIDNIPSAFYPSFVANISVNLANYGGATNLDFSWNYWPVYCSQNNSAGTDVPIVTQVGDTVKFSENFPSVDYNAFFTGGHQWQDASKISHNGTTAVVRGSDPNVGYIALNISTTMAYTSDPHVGNLNLYIKNIVFAITTPQQTAAPSQQSTGGSSGSSSSMAGVVAGAVIGGLALIVLIVLAVCLLRKRRNPREGLVDDSVVVLTEQVHQVVPPLPHHHQDESHAFSSPPANSTSHYSPHRSSSSSFSPASLVARRSYGPPPIYRQDDMTGQEQNNNNTNNRQPPSTTATTQASSPELARFAAANRAVIGENLEGRLQVAGYVPTEDPSRLTAEEWRDEYGISKLELRRLQNLYDRNHQLQPQ